MTHHSHSALIRFGIGAVVGAGLAMLLSPQPGTQLRGTLRRFAGRAKAEIKEKARQASEAATERASDMLRSGQAIAEEVIEGSRDAVRAAKDSVEATKDPATKAAGG